MPAACSFSGRLSTRNASTTMSCVADAVATSSAPSATNNGERAGIGQRQQQDRGHQQQLREHQPAAPAAEPARQHGTCKRIDQRRPQEFQRVGRADQREQPDGAEIDAVSLHPHQQRRSRQRQRQPGRKAEQQHDQHARLQIDRQAFAPGGAGRRDDRWSGGCRVRWSCRSASRFGHLFPLPLWERVARMSAAHS